MRIRIIMILLSTIVLLTSCSLESSSSSSSSTSGVSESEPEYKVLARSANLYITGLDEDDVIDISSVVEKFENTEAPRELNIEFNGNSYNVKYSESWVFYLYDATVDCYYEKIENGFGRGTCFFIGKNGEIRYFSPDPDYDEDSTSKKEEIGVKLLEEEDCLEIANAFLTQQIEDFSEYELYNVFYSKGSNYLFEFVRFVNGIKTSDRVSVAVNLFGDVIRYDARFLGHMKDTEAELPSEEDMLIIQEKIDAFEKKKFEGYAHSYIYEIVEIEFSRLYDGRYFLNYIMRDKAIYSDESPSFDEISYDEIDWGWKHSCWVFI